MTKSTLTALAFTHAYGYMPRYIQSQTFDAVVRCLDAVTGVRGRMYNVKPEHVATCEAHPMIIAVRVLERDGWEVFNDVQGRKVRAGVSVRKEIDGRLCRITVWTNGTQTPSNR